MRFMILKLKLPVFVVATVLVVGLVVGWWVSRRHDHLLTPAFWLLMACLCGLANGVAAWQVQRTSAYIARVRARVAQLLDGGDAIGAQWPVAPGEIGELVKVIRQVTVEREKAMRLQLKMIDQLQAILKNASVGILFTRAGRFELVGDNFCHQMGYTEQELLGELVRLIYPSDQAYAELGQRVGAAFASAGYFDGELTFKRKDDSLFWANMLGRAVVPNDPSKGTIWIVSDITKAREAREKLSWTASHDSLTQLVNRREYESRLGAALHQSGEVDLCVMFLDLDKFKLINDTAGHAAGDEALRQVARLLEHEVRQSDTVARLGGDEFAVLLPGCSLIRAQFIAEQMRARVAAWEMERDGQTFGLGASIGVVQACDALRKAEDLLQAADDACYQAKHRGRNQVVTYSLPTGAGEQDRGEYPAQAALVS